MQRGVYFLIKSGPSKKNQEKMWWDAVEGWNGRLNAGQGSDAATRASFNYWPLGPLILFSILLKKKKEFFIYWPRTWRPGNGTKIGEKIFKF